MCRFFRVAIMNWIGWGRIWRNKKPSAKRRWKASESRFRSSMMSPGRPSMSYSMSIKHDVIIHAVLCAHFLSETKMRRLRFSRDSQRLNLSSWSHPHSSFVSSLAIYQWPYHIRRTGSYYIVIPTLQPWLKEFCNAILCVSFLSQGYV